MTDRPPRHPREMWRGYLRVLEARDPETSPDRLRELAWDHIPPVRFYTATNRNCPPDILEMFAHRPELSYYVLHNPALPERALWYFTDDEWRRNFLYVLPRASFTYREVCYYHPSATEPLKAELRAQGLLEALRSNNPKGRLLFKDGRWQHEPFA